MKDINVAICIPSSSHVHTEFALSLAEMTAYTTAHSNVGLRVVNRMSSSIAQNRYDLVRDALKANNTHLLWLDTDHRFPPHLLVRLLNYGMHIVGCMYSTRHPSIYRGADGSLLYDNTLDLNRELQEVEFMGFGTILIRADVFRSMDPPWGFEFRWLPEARSPSPKFEGEDWGFCRVAREAGYRIYVDPALSYEIRHLGLFPYSIDPSADAELIEYGRDPRLPTGVWQRPEVIRRSSKD